jgi:hypothetical protein
MLKDLTKRGMSKDSYPKPKYLYDNNISGRAHKKPVTVE